MDGKRRIASEATARVLQPPAAVGEDPQLARESAARPMPARVRKISEEEIAPMSTATPTGPKMDSVAQALWHEVATASDEVAAILDRIPGLTVTGVETRNELERAAALLQAVAGILQRTERREGARYAAVNRSILGPDPVS